MQSSLPQAEHCRREQRKLLQGFLCKPQTLLDVTRPGETKPM